MFKYDYKTHRFIANKETPILTKNFAGIGTREINEVGKQAIRAVYEKTFGNKIEESPFEDDLTIAKLLLIPTKISTITSKERELTDKDIELFETNYKAITELAKDNNVSIEKFNDFLKHLKICL